MIFIVSELYSMYLRNLINNIKWSLAKVLGMSLVVFIIFTIIPFILFTLVVQICHAIIGKFSELLEYLLCSLDINCDDATVKYFSYFGFKHAKICIGNRNYDDCIANIKKDIKKNNFRCVILFGIHRENFKDPYYINIIAANNSTLNHLKLMYNTDMALISYH